MPKFHEVIRVPAAELDEMESILKSGKCDEQTGKDDVIKTYTAKFADGREADIKVCNAPTDGGGPWVDAVLFESDGGEIFPLEPGETLGGEYVFSVDGNEYEVFVVKE